jgi:tRNA nucleotidyltransferase/poly(A) polymerase
VTPKQDPVVQGLDAYVVGGAVRDALLGLPAGDRDWVVVGTTPEEMTRRGFIPVGGDFPVFLHPRTKEEFALARTERKSGRGYKGFTFYTGADVTLEDDLARRDLTINAIARHADGTLVDPCGGLRDLEQRVLRHVGEAFSEDPVRLLRLARFAARFDTFSIAEDTFALARHLVESGEVDALVPERVWQEVAKGLMTARPGRMFDVLQRTGALARVMPELVYDDELGTELACTHEQGLPLPSRFAVLCRMSVDVEALGKRVRAPSDCVSHAVLLQLILPALEPADARAALNLMERCDVMRKPQRFLDLLRAANCVRPVAREAWQRRVDALRGVDAGALARGCADKRSIPEAVRAARLAALEIVEQKGESEGSERSPTAT